MDLNSIVSAVFAAAIEQATKPLVERIAELERKLPIFEGGMEGGDLALGDRIDTISRSFAERLSTIADGIAKLELIHGQDDNGNPTHRYTELDDRLRAIENKLGLRTGPDADALNVAPTAEDPLAQSMIRLRNVESQVADLTTVLGAVYQITNLSALAEEVTAGNPDALRLADQMQYRIKDVANDTCAEWLAEHNSDYCHDNFYADGDAIWDDIVHRVESHVENEIEDRDLICKDDMRDEVSRVLRNASFTVDVEF